MTRGMMWMRTALLIFAWGYYLFAAALLSRAADPLAGEAMLYVRRPSVQETLLATRACYQTWLAQQTAVRRQVKLGPWLGAAAPRGDAEALAAAEIAEAVAKQTDGPSPWKKPVRLNDGTACKLSFASPQGMLLTRIIEAEKPVEISIGVGGGDRLDLWLNAARAVSRPTRLAFDRYGCSEPCEGTRVDQVLLNLRLRAGKNRLLLRLTPSRESSFYFSIAPDPVPALWSRVRADFPAAENPLLETATLDWFPPRGWFAAPDHGLEQRLLQRLAAGSGPGRGVIDAGLEQLTRTNTPRDDRRWLDLCVKAAVWASLSQDLARLRAAVIELGRSHPGDYPAVSLLTRLDDYGTRLSAQAGGRLDPAEQSTRRLMDEMPRLRHEMLVQHSPLLKDVQLLFVKRSTYNSKHFYDDIQHISRWGGNLCVLSLADGRVRELAPQLAGGVFDRYDLSFDARRVVFGYRRPKAEGFRLWEIGIDGRGLRQVTQPPADEDRRIARYGQTSTGDGFYDLKGYRFWTDDLHPCYLPDGGLCFATTRCEHGVLCTPNHYLACTNLFRVDAGGGGLRPISHGALSEFTPTMMEDGRILYNRWEYVYKGIAAVQPLWVMRPDGSGSEEFYGDNIGRPGVFWQARQVPGRPRLAVCIGCGHEPLGVGSVLLLNLDKDKRTPEPMTSLTPDVKIEGLRGIYHLRHGQWREDIYGPLYADPYPLSDKFFLVSCNPDQRYNHRSAYGIYLLDVYGNRVPLYHDPEISSWEPMPLRPRTRPPALPPAGPETPQSDAGARLFVSDVYRGLEGVKPGTVKYLRVMEQVPKPWAAEVDPLRGEDRSADGFGGHLAISWNTHIWVAVLHGVVPVHDDGSAYFAVPAGRNLFLQALDRDFMEVQRMRTFVTLQPGETRSCIGCHEHRTQAPVSRVAAAFGRLPAALSAQPGELAPRPLYYPTDVQPILDRHCVGCHHGHDSQAPPDLRGALTTLFSRSYEGLLQSGQVDAIREWAGSTYAMQNAEAVPPYSHGSHRSRLVALLKQGHYDVRLAREEWINLVTWIDCGAPYYGSYFGRRNLKYKDQPGFRPVPTLESACGIEPDVR